MRYGLSFPNGGPCHDARTLGQFARLAEESGWDGAFLEDYIIWQGHMDAATYDPWIALAAMALSTNHIRLGTMVTPLPRRRPWKLARETVTLDHLSYGRIVLGIGLGDTTLDSSLTRFGEETDSKRRAKMVDEGLEVLDGLWSGRPFSYDGDYYHVNEVTLLPRPVQSPRIPIWIGGVFPLRGPIRRAARWDGACLYKATGDDMTPGDILALKKEIETYRAPAGSFDIAVGGRHRGDDWERERALIRSLDAAGATWWIEYLPPQIGGVKQIQEAIKRGPLRV